MHPQPTIYIATDGQNVWYLEPHDEGVRRIVIRGFLELYCLWEEYLMQRGHCGR